MAPMGEDVQFESDDQGLKHVAFMREAAIRALVCVSNLYEYAKQNSGPLRSTVGTVEGAVATVVGPVYDKYKDVPDHLLVFLDSKVDEASHKFDEHVPPAGKEMVNQAQDLVHIAAQKAQKLVDEARTNGPRGALHYASSEYKHLVLVSSTMLWVKLNHSSAFHSVAEMIVPTASNLSEKYNCLVTDMSGKGYPVFGYLPLVPVGELREAVKQAEGSDTAMNKKYADAPRKLDSDSVSGSASASGSDSDSVQISHTKDHVDAGKLDSDSGSASGSGSGYDSDSDSLPSFCGATAQAKDMVRIS